VPFFGTKAALVLHESEEPVLDRGKESGTGGQKVTKAQLLELQRKMLNHLMELYGD
jgi:hypothetical protein